MTAFNFCCVEKMKALGHGSGALVGPRVATGLHSEVMTIACPPITVRHVATKHEWVMEVDFYLGVYNDRDRFTLPQPANVIYGNNQEGVEAIRRQAAQYVLWGRCWCGDSRSAHGSCSFCHGSTRATRASWRRASPRSKAGASRGSGRPSRSSGSGGFGAAALVPCGVVDVASRCTRGKHRQRACG